MVACGRPVADGEQLPPPAAVQAAKARTG